MDSHTAVRLPAQTSKDENDGDGCDLKQVVIARNGVKAE